MIYEFPFPKIADSKDLAQKFLKKKEVPSRYHETIKALSKHRNHIKPCLRDLAVLNNSYGDKEKQVRNPSEKISSLNTYAESVVGLKDLFPNNYEIKPRLKWTPLFTIQEELIVVSDRIKTCISAEIIMTKYAAFCLSFLDTRQDLAFIKNLFIIKDVVKDSKSTNNLEVKHRLEEDPKILDIKTAIEKILSVQKEAWLLLQSYYENSTDLFDILSRNRNSFIELTSTGMEIAILLTNLSANTLRIELLRMKGEWKRMGQYAKTVVLQAKEIEDKIHLQNCTHQTDQKLYDFVVVCQNMYKAIALWSRLFEYQAKIVLEIYEDTENQDIVKGFCLSLVQEIKRLHSTITKMTNFKANFFPEVFFYFHQVMFPRCEEVRITCSSCFPSSYDEVHFNKIHPLDEMDKFNENVIIDIAEESNVNAPHALETSLNHTHESVNQERS